MHPFNQFVKSNMKSTMAQGMSQQEAMKVIGASWMLRKEVGAKRVSKRSTVQQAARRCQQRSKSLMLRKTSKRCVLVVKPSKRSKKSPLQKAARRCQQRSKSLMLRKTSKRCVLVVKPSKRSKRSTKA